MSSLWGLRYLETHGIFTIGGQIYLRYLETHALVYRLEAGYVASVLSSQVEGRSHLTARAES